VGLPIFKRPSDTATLLEEVARFRALPPTEQVKAIMRTIAEGNAWIDRQPNAEAIRTYLDEQEELGNRKIREFIARHAPEHLASADECPDASGPSE
jgi:hypothetical protein